jgi:hypothetical protein
VARAGKKEADRDLNTGTRAQAAQTENRCAATKNGRIPCSREEKQNRPAARSVSENESRRNLAGRLTKTKAGVKSDKQHLREMQKSRQHNHQSNHEKPWMRTRTSHTISHQEEQRTTLFTTGKIAGCTTEIQSQR